MANHTACAHLDTAYQQRRPETTLLYKIISDQIETFLAQSRQDGYGLPRHVEREFYSYLECGIHAYGFSTWRCGSCGNRIAVAFSCKCRGFCPSCQCRRMSEIAANLVDEVLPPEAPLRQFVLTVPLELRYRLAYDHKLLSAVLKIFMRAVFSWYRAQAKRAGFKESYPGAITFIQLAGSALNVTPHFHSILLDGVFAKQPGEGHLQFVQALQPKDTDIQAIVEKVSKRVLRMLKRKGLIGYDISAVDQLRDEAPMYSELLQQSVLHQEATGPRAGMKVRRILHDPPHGIRQSPLCFAASGFSLHAKTSIKAHLKQRKEELIRYAARPPLASRRLQMLDDGNVLLQLKSKWSDGSTHLVMSPLVLIEKLAAIVPPRRANLVRYGGCLAPNSKIRKQIIPQPAHTLALAPRPKRPIPDATTPPPDFSLPTDEGEQQQSRRINWPDLMKRVFQKSVTKCTRCGSTMELCSVITDEESIKAYCEGVGLPSEAPTIAPARGPPQPNFDFDDYVPF